MTEKKERNEGIIIMYVFAFIVLVTLINLLMSMSYETGKVVNYEYMVENNCKELVSENSNYLEDGFFANFTNYNFTRKNITDFEMIEIDNYKR